MADAKIAIRQMFETYRDCYDRLDARALADLHGSPCIVVHRGDVLVLNDENKISYHEDILAENAAEGEHVWEMAACEVELVAPNGATAKLHWVAKRPDGSVLWEDRPAYVVADDGDGWLIWSNISSNS
jgi:ketosteroid isomerase-like protein